MSSDTVPSDRGRHLKRYSVISTTPRYVFVLLHNALTLLRSVIASDIYHSGHIGAVIASYSVVIAISLSISIIVSINFRFSVIMYLLFPYSIPLRKELKGDVKFISQNSLLKHVICTLKTRYSITSCWRLAF
jgi:hypothetical protein